VKVAIVVGNPKPGSRTLEVARAVAERICVRTGAAVSIDLDLAVYGSKLFDWPCDEVAALNEAVRQSDVVVAASPTYKATYTGLLKAFLDRYPNNGLAGVTAIPVMTASTPLHGMAIEAGLRPLLVELGASVPTRGLFFLMSNYNEVEPIVESWAEENIREGSLFGPLQRVKQP
jgi:FMN reductase